VPEQNSSRAPDTEAMKRGHGTLQKRGQIWKANWNECTSDSRPVLLTMSQFDNSGNKLPCSPHFVSEGTSCQVHLVIFSFCIFFSFAVLEMEARACFAHTRQAPHSWATPSAHTCWHLSSTLLAKTQKDKQESPYAAEKGKPRNQS
jgi:hypothetical protein